MADEAAPAPAPDYTAVDKLTLYSIATPNGVKAAVMLEEVKEAVEGFDYDAVTIDIRSGAQATESFLAISPNGKIPCIYDPTVEGEAAVVFETGAILIYLAEKYGILLPPASQPAARANVLKWTIWQVAGHGPNMGQLGHFYRREDSPYAKERFSTEVKRLFGVLEKQLATTAASGNPETSFICGAYSIADVCTFPWVRAMKQFNPAAVTEVLEDMAPFPNVAAWLDRCMERPASQRGVAVTPF